jgi:branched-chain amino acid transport system ATP-binding protein
MNTILEVKKLNKYFGGVAALSNLDMDVREGEIMGVIGPNGAGKTTLFSTISGFFPATSGRITFRGMDITGLTADRVSGLGLTRTFQATTLFMGISVLENMFTGYHLSYRTALWKRWLRTGAAIEEEESLRQKAKEILSFMGLHGLVDEMAANLPHGHQRILGVCLALATQPKLLLLDEPMTGMNPVETENMTALVRQIRDRGITIALVEHDMKAVMNLCDRIIVLNYGQKIAEGTPAEIRENKLVVEAYLGREGAE